MVYHFKALLERFQLFVSKFISMFLSLVKLLVLSKFNPKIPVTTKKEVIVIGNGPSFKKALLESPSFFENKDLVCVNSFPSTPEYELLKPATLVWLDNGYFPRNGAALHPDIVVLIETIIKKTTWELNMFLPQLAISAKHLKEIAEKNTNIKIVYFNYTIVKGFDWFCNFFYKRNLGMPLCQNVVVGAIFLAVNMKYKNIYLLGVENSFFKNIIVDDNNEVFLHHSHFYTEKDKSTITKMHKMPGSKYSADIADVLMMLVKTFKGYKEIKKYADYTGTSIYNLTEGSYVDAFERKKINEIK